LVLAGAVGKECPRPVGGGSGSNPTLGCGKKLAEGVGFEPTWRVLAAKSISSRPRYGHFGTPPHATYHFNGNLLSLEEPAGRGGQREKGDRLSPLLVLGGGHDLAGPCADEASVLAFDQPLLERSVSDRFTGSEKESAAPVLYEPRAGRHIQKLLDHVFLSGLFHRHSPERLRFGPVPGRPPFPDGGPPPPAAGGGPSDLCNRGRIPASPQ
jgi:hypothetical protein